MQNERVQPQIKKERKRERKKERKRLPIMKLSKSQFEEVLHFCCRSAALLLQKCCTSAAEVLLFICARHLSVEVENPYLQPSLHRHRHLRTICFKSELTYCHILYNTINQFKLFSLSPVLQNIKLTAQKWHLSDQCATFSCFKDYKIQNLITIFTCFLWHRAHSVWDS